MNWDELVFKDDARAFIELLSGECRVRPPRVSFTGRTNHRGFYRTRAKTITVGKWTKLWILAHEFAHYLDHIENNTGEPNSHNDREWHSHGFYYKLRRLTRICGGEYPWHYEYKQLARWAAREKLTESM